MDRNEDLMQKINEINTNFNMRSNKYNSSCSESLENKLEITKKKIRFHIQKNKQQLDSILKEGQQLSQKLQKSHLQFLNESRDQLDRLRKLEAKIKAKIDLQVSQRKQRQHSIIGMFEYKSTQLKKQIQKQRNVRQKFFLEINNTLEDDLPFILEQLNSAKDQFSKQQQQTTQNCLSIIEQTQKYLGEFTEEQESHSNKAFQLIKDLTKKIRAQIEEQKSVCQITHEQVFAYVEQTCSKLIQL